MSWWQIALIILGSIIVGLLVGYLLYYLGMVIMARRRKKTVETPVNEPQPTVAVPEPPQATVVFKPPRATVVAEPPKAAVAPEPPKAKAAPEPPKVKAAPEPPKAAAVPEPPKVRVVPKPAKARVVPEPPKATVPDIFLEIENNRLIANQTWTGNLQSFQTQAWDNKRDEIHSLPPEVREALTQAYFDMSLANSVVWLATEMGRRSPSLDESYLKLRNSIADRLNRVKPTIEQLRSGQS